MRTDCSLSGPTGVLEYGTVQAGRFGSWTLRPMAPNVSELLVEHEELHAYYGAKPLTHCRIRFRPDKTSRKVTWWAWRNPIRLAPGRYRLEGLPDREEAHAELVR